MLKKTALVLIVLFLMASVVPMAYAHCPLCTAAVGAAAVSAKYYGMDLSIIGLLIGAFGVSTGLWIGLKVRKYFRLQLPLIVFASFLLTVIPLLAISDETLYFPLLLIGKAGSAFNKVYWINKLLLGSIIGGLMTVLSYVIHAYIKKLRGKVLFPFQGVAFTLFSLAISGLAMYFTIGA